MIRADQGYQRCTAPSRNLDGDATRRCQLVVMCRPGFQRLWLAQSSGRAKAVNDGLALARLGPGRGPSRQNAGHHVSDARKVWCEFPSAHGMKIGLIDSILTYARQT
jgi:hypothetical protein